MKKSILTILGIIISISSSFAQIPDGYWRSESGSIETHFKSPAVHDSFLDIPTEYGLNTVFENGILNICVFGEPEISGNTAKFTGTLYAYDYSGSYPTKTGEYACLITFDPATQILQLKYGDKTLTFKDSERMHYIALSENDNVNIRKSPQNGQIILKARTGQTFRLLSETNLPGNGGKWYEIELPDKSKGYISAKFSNLINQATIPDDVINEKESAYRIDVPDESITLSFKRKGNRILMGFEEMFLHGTASVWFYSGVIKDNRIILTKSLWMNDGYKAFYDFDFAKFDKEGAIQDPPLVYYYLDGNIYHDGKPYILVRDYD